MRRNCRGWGDRWRRAALTNSVHCRPDSALKIFVYMSHLDKEKRLCSFHNQSVNFQRTLSHPHQGARFSGPPWAVWELIASHQTRGPQKTLILFHVARVALPFHLSRRAHPPSQVIFGVAQGPYGRILRRLVTSYTLRPQPFHRPRWWSNFRVDNNRSCTNDLLCPLVI